MRSGGSGRCGSRHNFAGAVVLAELVDFEGLIGDAVFGFLDLVAVNVDLVANLDVRGDAGQGVGFFVAIVYKLEAALTGDDATLEVVVRFMDMNQDGGADGNG